MPLDPTFNISTVPRFNFDDFLFSATTVFQVRVAAPGSVRCVPRCRVAVRVCWVAAMSCVLHSLWWQILTTEKWTTIVHDGWRAKGWKSNFYFLIVMVVGTFVVLNLFLAILLSNFQGLELRREAEKEANETAGGSSGSRSSNASVTDCKWLSRVWNVRYTCLVAWLVLRVCLARARHLPGCCMRRVRGPVAETVHQVVCRRPRRGCDGTVGDEVLLAASSPFRYRSARGS